MRRPCRPALRRCSTTAMRTPTRVTWTTHSTGKHRILAGWSAGRLVGCKRPRCTSEYNSYGKGSGNGTARRLLQHSCAATACIRAPCRLGARFNEHAQFGKQRALRLLCDRLRSLPLQSTQVG